MMEDLGCECAHKYGILVFGEEVICGCWSRGIQRGHYDYLAGAENIIEIKTKNRISK
jgi:hypothetical protein